MYFVSKKTQARWMAVALIASQSTAMASPAGVRTFALEPEPTDVASIESQLKRFAGQTQFLNPLPYWQSRRGMPEKGANKSEDAMGGSQREIQESDVFKVGKSGSKLLHLLNDYRGLQTVSFADGVTSPKILSRVAPTGNYPQDMYADHANDRLIVLENLWVDESGDYAYDRAQSRVLIYDVKNANAPAVSQSLELQGEIADSRMVGDVLYVATSIRPYYWSRNGGQQQQAKGFVYSIRLGKQDIGVIEQVELALPSSSSENMNIVEVPVSELGSDAAKKSGAKFKYYLLAVLSESGWGWWDRQSLVEVVDISDAKGKIKPLMVASAKGMVAERSQTTIKNDTLIVTSNYRPESQGAQDSKMRVAVETFRLPTEKSEKITENESQYRKLHIERSLKGKTGEAREALEKKLLADAELGLIGRFVETEDGKLRKIFADSVVTIGDTQGQHAGLQDVRYVGDRLYVFWVPQNQIDPFDLFDISQPEKEVKYLKRLQFDGWIERAIPVTHAGHEYVLGLGHIVENVNNENSRRYPQAMLFEIINHNGQPRAIDVAQITLKKAGWTSFNGGDKFIEVRSTGDGAGTIMFAASSYENGDYASGGKLVGFDLNAAASGEGAVFKEGAMMVGDSGWLKRVFTNSEIAKVNTFSNTSLGTFEVSGDVGSAGDTARAISVLELARNINGYVTLASTGVQLISHSDWYKREGSKVELRQVKSTEADAEADQILSKLEIAGDYLTHKLSADGNTLKVATSTHKLIKKGEHYWDNVYETTYSVCEVTTGRSGWLMNAGCTSWKPEQEKQDDSRHFYSYRPFQLIDIQNRTFALAGSSVIEISAGKSRALSLSGCGELEKMNEVELKILNGALFLFMKKHVEDPKRENLSYSRNLLAPILLGSALQGSAQCSAAINIPGEPVAVYPGHVVTQDERLADLIERKIEGENGSKSTYYETITSQAMESLKLSGATATLVDDYEMEAGQSLQLIGERRFGTLESAVEDRYYNDFDGWRMSEVARPWRPYSSKPSKLVSIGFDKDLRFTKEVFGLAEKLVSGAALSQVIREKDGTHLGVIVSGRKVQVLKWTDAERRPKLVQSVVLPGWFYGSVNFSSATRTLEFPMGYHGVQQVKVGPTFW